METCVPDDLDIFKFSGDPNVVDRIEIKPYVESLLLLMKDIRVSLKISNFRFNDDSLINIFDKGIKNCVNLQILDLTGCRLIQFEYLQLVPEKLTGLILQDCNIEDQMIDNLGKVVQDMKFLISLNLSSNLISDKGVEMFSQAIINMDSLDYVFLKNNKTSFSPISILKGLGFHGKVDPW
jgi:Leucine-rich repeat (LRR) protein